jgi:Uma2 family endonuclease
MAPAPVSPYLSEEEYLALDRAAEQRSEYYDGQMYAMAGGTGRHSKIGGNLFAEFRSRLRGNPCEPFNSGMRVRIPKTGSYVYADLALLCGEEARLASAGDIAENPILVAEVLSPSTERFDRGAKFDKYRTIDSLREYMLVSQDEPLVELFSRQPGNRWLLTIARGLDASIRIDSLHCEIPLAGIYENVAMDAAEPPDP